MTLLILAAAVCGWDYEGFASDPAPPVSAPAIRPETPRPAPPDRASGFVAPPAVMPEARATPPATRPETPPPASPSPPIASGPVAPKTVAPKARATAPPRPPAAPAPPSRPVLWRLPDASGQTWEHADLDALRRFVAERNSALALQTAWQYRMTMPGAYRMCPTGGCPNTR